MKIRTEFCKIDHVIAIFQEKNIIYSRSGYQAISNLLKMHKKMRIEIILINNYYNKNQNGI